MCDGNIPVVTSHTRIHCQMLLKLLYVCAMYDIFNMNVCVHVSGNGIWNCAQSDCVCFIYFRMNKVNMFDHVLSRHTFEL